MDGTLPRFDLAGSDLLLALVRGCFVAALLSGLGVPFFRSVIVRHGLGRMAQGETSRLERDLALQLRVSLAAQLVALLLWLALQARAFADASTVVETVSALPRVLTGTQFGHLAVGQAACAAIALVALGRGDRLRRWDGALVAMAVAVILQAGHGHGYAMSEGVGRLSVSDGVHLLCAGAWLGGLGPLLTVLRSAPGPAGAAATRSFSAVALWVVGGLLLSAGYQGWCLVGDLPRLIGTAYGWMVAAKLLILGVLLALAVANRFALTPALDGNRATFARARLLRNVAIEILLGIAALIAAALLSGLPPGIHTQPVWPFALRPSLITVAEDPDLKRAVVQALLILALAVALPALTWPLRRLRWVSALAAAVLAWVAVPDLRLLLVEAYPTSYFESPTGFAAASIARGAELYPGQCAGCHGAFGRGDGPLAGTLPVPPADLTAGHLWEHADGELYWWLAKGIAAPRGGWSMPGFAGRLTDDELWGLIDFVRARNAGSSRQADSSWSPPLQAPGVQASCADGATLSLGDLRGKVVRLVFGPPADAAPVPTIPLGNGMALVTLLVPAADGNAAGEGGACIVSDPAARTAYALVSGLPSESIDGVQFLIDPDGWLRATQARHDDVPAPWDDPRALREAALEICRHPLPRSGGSHAHIHAAD